MSYKENNTSDIWAILDIYRTNAGRRTERQLHQIHFDSYHFPTEKMQYIF